LDASPASQAGIALASDSPVVVDDFRREGRFHASGLLGERGIRSGVNVAIQGREHPFGVLGVYSRKLQGFKPEDASVVQAAAQFLAPCIQRISAEAELRSLTASLEEQLDERTRLLRLLLDVMAMTEERLRESENQIIEAQHLARLGSWEWDFNADSVTLSQELLRIFDLAEGEFEGTTQAFLNKVHPDDLEIVKTALQRARETGIPFNVQHRIIRSTGQQRVLQTRGRVARNEQGHPVRIIGTSQDVTVMATITDRLRERDMLLENILAQSQIILWSIDPQGTLRLSRRGGLAALGVPSGDQLGVNVFERLSQDHPLANYLSQSLGGTAVYIDYKFGERTYDLRILPLMDQQGKITGVNGIAFDITQRIETEQALRKSEQNYRLVVDSVQDYAIFTLDQEGHVTSWNQGAKQVKGYQASEILGKHFSVFFTPEDRDRGLPQEILQIALQQGKFGGEGWRVRKDGVLFWANTLLSPIKDEKGDLLGFTKVVRDYTGQRVAEQAIQESEKRFRSIFEFGAMGLALLDLGGNFLLANPSLQTMFGFQEQELLAHSLKSLAYPLDSSSLMKIFAGITAGQESLFRRESRFQRKDGQIVWVSLTFSLVRDADDAPAFIIGMFEDITYRKQMEAELRAVKRQLIVSEEKQRQYLAQELHDDPMQELYGILFQLESLDVETVAGSALQNELQTQLMLAKDSTEKVIQKLRVICGQLRPNSLAPFGLEGAIREHIDRFKEEHPTLKVQLELAYDGQLLSEEVRISLFRIYQQALGNVIRHAQASSVIVRFYYDDQNASLEVEDDGLGFDVPDSLLTLARQDHLGIAGAAERAELLGGRLTVHSSSGKGTLVHVTIPLKPFEDPAIREVKSTQRSIAEEF
jgi:PAS domain S-box-containing protein